MPLPSRSRIAGWVVSTAVAALAAAAGPAARAQTPAAAAPTADVAAILKAVDRFRTGQGPLQVETQVVVLGKDGSVDKERAYTVYLQAERNSLVLMRSPAERGQKVLMSGNEFWLVMPGSQRPLRITAAQKLLGDASTGDIATMRWAEDYTASLLGEEKCGKQACLKLQLTASRSGVSYARIDLWVATPGYQPLQADLYVQSGKLAKQARFLMEDPKAPDQVSEMVLVDQLSNAKETRIKYLTRTPKVVPPQWLNPMYLATNPLD